MCLLETGEGGTDLPLAGPAVGESAGTRLAQLVNAEVWTEGLKPAGMGRPRQQLRDERAVT